MNPNSELSVYREVHQCLRNMRRSNGNEWLIAFDQEKQRLIMRTVTGWPTQVEEWMRDRTQFVVGVYTLEATPNDILEDAMLVVTEAEAAQWGA